MPRSNASRGNGDPEKECSIRKLAEIEEEQEEQEEEEEEEDEDTVPEEEEPKERGRGKRKNIGGDDEGNAKSKWRRTAEPQAPIAATYMYHTKLTGIQT